MSGGTFDYQQYKLLDLADDMEDQFDDNKEFMNNRTQLIYNQTINNLRYIEIVVKRLDWLIAGDDGQETFNERLEQELNKLENKIEHI